MKTGAKTALMLFGMAAIAAIAALLVLWRGALRGIGILVVVSPHQEGIQREFEKAFANWHRRNYGHPPVKIVWIDVGGTTKDEQYVRSSFKEHPEGGDFDVFFGGGTDPYLEFMNSGLSLPFKLPDAQLEELPREVAGVPLYDPLHNWYGTSVTAFGILYNKELLRRLGLPTPATWEDMASPKFFNLVSLADPRYSGTIRMMLEIMLQGYGWEKGLDLIVRMGANARTIVHNSSQAAREITLGEAVCGLSVDFYAWAEIAQGGRDNMGFVMPAGLTVMNPDSIAILRGAPHLELAKRFVTFVMSEEGQRLWMLPVGAPGGPKEYALRRMAALPSVYRQYEGQIEVTANPFETKTGMKYDPEKGGIRKDILNDLVGAMVIDTHSELKKAYRAIIDKGMPGKYLQMLSRPPVTEEEAMDMAKENWGDASFRAKKLAEWIEFSRKKFEAIVRELS